MKFVAMKKVMTCEYASDVVGSGQMHSRTDMDREQSYSTPMHLAFVREHSLQGSHNILLSAGADPTIKTRAYVPILHMVLSGLSTGQKLGSYVSLSTSGSEQFIHHSV